MHWKFFDFVKKLNLTMKRLNALTSFRYDLAVSATDIIAKFWLCDLAVSITDVVAKLWLFNDANKSQTEKQNEPQTNKQTTKRRKWNDVCWLLKQTNWFAKNDEKQRFNRDVFIKRIESIVNKIIDHYVFMRRAKNFDKKNQKQWNCQQNN